MSTLRKFVCTWCGEQRGSGTPAQNEAAIRGHIQACPKLLEWRRSFAERALRQLVPNGSERYFNHGDYTADYANAIAAAEAGDE